MRRVHKTYLAALPFPVLVAMVACSGGQPDLALNPGGLTGGTGASGGSGGAGATAGDASGGLAGTAGRGGSGGKGTMIDVVDPPEMMCPPITCAGLGYACGSIRDECGKIINCADEGLACGALEACTGGADGPTKCVTSLGEDCTACAGVPDCSKAAQVTKLTGRVITPGKDDANALNQLGVPNAFVYILRTNDLADLPAITSGIPDGGTSCDRCEDQDLGPVLVGALTDATGAFTLEGNIPVGMEFTLVVKAGRFRRAIKYTVPETAACMTTTLPTALPDNPTRLPRAMDDGIAVNIPRIAVSTGAADGMECVLYKMGIAGTEFVNPGADGMAAGRVHLYRGGAAPTGVGTGGMGGMGGTGGVAGASGGGAGGAGGTAGGKGGKGGGPLPGAGPSGARIDDETPHDRQLYNQLPRLQSYDIVIADCEGGGYDQAGTDRRDSGDNVREYVNRGGRLFASHLEFTWLQDNGTAPFDAADPIATGLANAAQWAAGTDLMSTMETGGVSLARPQASARIQNFADWMVNEGVTMAGVNTFEIIDPRSQVAALGPTAEEFVYEPENPTHQDRVEQFSVNTPVGATDEAVCGRVAYSGFHVAASTPGATDPNANVIFPAHCMGDLTPQEKVLLYMLFDLNACVGETPPPPVCTPQSCTDLGIECGYANDGCGTPLDCGVCPVMPPK